MNKVKPHPLQGLRHIFESKKWWLGEGFTSTNVILLLLMFRSSFQSQNPSAIITCYSEFYVQKFYKGTTKIASIKKKA